MKDMKERIKAWFDKRYGADELGITIGILSVVFLILGELFGSLLFLTVSMLCLGIFTFRALSAQHWDRKAENEQFCRYIKLWKLRFEYRKEARIFMCAKCGRFVRVPKGKGKIQITCPSCGTRMIKRT